MSMAAIHFTVMSYFFEKNFLMNAEALWSTGNASAFQQVNKDEFPSCVYSYRVPIALKHELNLCLPTSLLV